MNQLKLVETHEQRAHAKLSPSSAHRWLRCPASIEACRDIKDTSSVHAEEGTAAHELAETVLRNPTTTAAHYIDNVFNGFTVDDEMAMFVQQYVDRIHSLEGNLDIEVRLDLREYAKDSFGTADAVTLDASSKRLYVGDLKYGKGVRVEAEGNEQAMMYALGALQEYAIYTEIDEIVIGIYQPRLHHFPEWTITREALLAFGETVKLASAAALKPNAAFNAGEKQCSWCLNKGNCRALADHQNQLIGSQFDNLDIIEKVDTLTLAEIGEKILPNLKLLEQWTKAVQHRAYEALELGHDVPGYKMVEGRSVRRWADEKAVSDKLSASLDEDDVWQRKLVTVAQAEKLVGKKEFAELFADDVSRPAGKPTIAPESDKRPALTPALEFDIINSN